MFGIGAGEFIVILIVGLIVFGPSKSAWGGGGYRQGYKRFPRGGGVISADA